MSAGMFSFTLRANYRKLFLKNAICFFSSWGIFLLCIVTTSMQVFPPLCSPTLTITSSLCPFSQLSLHPAITPVPAWLSLLWNAHFFVLRMWTGSSNKSQPHCPQFSVLATMLLLNRVKVRWHGWEAHLSCQWGTSVPTSEPFIYSPS